MNTVFENIKLLLNEHQTQFTLSHHGPTLTSEASALARGESIHIGAKALLLKVDNDFKLFVMSAPLKIDSKAVKSIFNARKIRFATAEELFDLTGLGPGSVPPFGEPILPFQLYIDESILSLSDIAFNAGSLTDSIKMKTEGYLKIAGGVVIRFTQI